MGFGGMGSTMSSGCHVPLTTVNEKKLGNIKISEVLGSQAQHHVDVEPSEKSVRGDSLDDENTQIRADIQPEEIFTEGAKSQRKANATVAKPNNGKIKSEEENVVDQTRSKDSEKIKVHPSIYIFFRSF